MPEGDNLLEHLSKEMKEHDKDIIDMLKGKSENNDWANAFIKYHGDKLKGLTLADFDDFHSYVINEVFAKDGDVYIKEDSEKESRLWFSLQDTVIKIPES